MLSLDLKAERRRLLRDAEKRVIPKKKASPKKRQGSNWVDGWR